MPHHTGLGKSVQEHQGRAFAADPREDPTRIGCDVARRKAGKQIGKVGHRKVLRVRM